MRNPTACFTTTQNMMPVLKTTLKTSVKLSAVLSVFLLFGCNQNVKNPMSTSNQAQADHYVDQNMSQVITSVDHSLQELVRIDRGDEGPRKASPLGSTVAGAAGPRLAPFGMSAQADLNTPLGRSQAAAAEDAQIAANRAWLAKRVRLDWSGSASGFLSDLSTKMGYTFEVNGSVPTPEPNIRLHVKDSTVESVLDQAAHQVNAVADIHVNLLAKRIELSYR